MPSKKKPDRRPDGTLNDLTAALGLSKRRVSALLVEGMPDTPAEAVEWRDNRENDSSVESLRRARILLVTEQRRRAELENGVRQGQLVDAGQVRADVTRVVSAARSEFLKLPSELPGQLVGLDEASMQAILRTAVIEILTRLSDESSALYATEPPLS